VVIAGLEIVVEEIAEMVDDDDDERKQEQDEMRLGQTLGAANIKLSSVKRQASK